MRLDEEDLALCEFVCTSKTPVTKILRDGLKATEKRNGRLNIHSIYT